MYRQAVQTGVHWGEGTATTELALSSALLTLTNELDRLLLSDFLALGLTLKFGQHGFPLTLCGDVPGNKLVPSRASQGTLSGRECHLLKSGRTLPLFSRREGPEALDSCFWLDSCSLQGDGAGGLLQDRGLHNLSGRILTQLQLGLLQGREVAACGPG